MIPPGQLATPIEIEAMYYAHYDKLGVCAKCKSELSHKMHFCFNHESFWDYIPRSIATSESPNVIAICKGCLADFNRVWVEWDSDITRPQFMISLFGVEWLLICDRVS